MYYTGELLGITKEFKVETDEDVQHAIYEADKKSYGTFIFTKTIGGFKEVVTGKTFKTIEHGRASDGYPYYGAPKNTGLVVDKNEVKKIPIAKSKEAVAEYKAKLNKDDLLTFFKAAQEETDKYLEMGKLGGKSLEEIDFGPKQSAK